LRDLLQALDVTNANETRARPMYAAVPERVNLRLNQVQTLRAQLISLLAGGGSAEWNNVKLAEGLARIGSGRAVRARLIRSVRKGGREQNRSLEEAASLPLQPQALQWVREGLSLPSTPGGTAAALGPALSRWKTELSKTLGRKDVDLVYYSKTGTPRKHDVGPDSAAYVFYLGLLLGGQPNGAVSGSIYIEDRGGSGLAVALAEGAMWSDLGATVRIGVSDSPAVELFGESPSRIVVTATPRHVPALELLARQHGLPVETLGVVGGERLVIELAGAGATGSAEGRGSRVADALDVPIHDLRHAWEHGLPRALGWEVPA
jgi:hypothetical protein